MKKTNIFKCKPPEVHFTIRNRVPYNKLLTNITFSSRTGEHLPSVVFVRTSLRSGQYSPVRPSRSVSKRLLGSLSMQRFWATDDNRKSSHCHIYIVKHLFTNRDNCFENLRETTVQACEMFTSGCRPWLKNVACLSSLIGRLRHLMPFCTLS